MPPRSTGGTELFRSTWSDRRLALVLVAAFFVFNLVGLDGDPMVSRDEPWIAEPGYQFWARGALVSELHRGFFGVERHYLLASPFFSILTGGVIWLFGPGLLQVRLVSLALATATAALTFAVGSRLFSPRHGLLAVLMLTMWRVASGLRSYPSGIPLVDLGRLARYDIAVPAASMTAFLLVLPLLAPRAATGQPAGATHHDSTPEAATPIAHPRVRLALAGLCLGLAVASHPPGLAWIAILSVTLLMARGTIGGVAACGWLLAGTTAALLPYLWFMYRGWDDLLLQQQYYAADRYDVSSPRFYVDNVLAEWRRYSPIGHGLLAAQPAAWLIGVCGLTGLWVLWQGSERHTPGGRVLRQALLVGAGLFAVFIQPELYHYVATLWPLIALTAAVGLVTLQRSPVPFVRPAIVAMLVLTMADGVAAWIGMMHRATTITSYRALCERLAAQLPNDSRVLALPNFWLGLAPHVRDYRSLTGPMVYASPRFAAAHPPLGEMLAETGATVVLVDPLLSTFMEHALDPAKPAHEFVNSARGLRDYLARESERRVVVDDPSYGRFEIHYLRRQRAVP